MIQFGAGQVLDFRFGDGWEVDRIYRGSELLWLSALYIPLPRLAYHSVIEDAEFAHKILMSQIEYELTIEDVGFEGDEEEELISFSSWVNPLSQGDRTSLITVTTNAVVGNGNINNLVNGLSASSSVAAVWLQSNQTNRWINFEFPHPIHIDRLLMFFAGTSSGMGTWRVEGSNDLSNWDVLSDNHAWSSSARPEVAEEIGLPINGFWTCDSENAYKHIRLVQTGGLTDNNWITVARFMLRDAEPYDSELLEHDYENPLGMGVRYSSILITSDVILGSTSSPFPRFISRGPTDTNSIWFDTPSQSDRFIKFEFPVPVNINEILWRRASTSGDHGTWRWEIWDDGEEEWVPVGDSFILAPGGTGIHDEMAVMEGFHRRHRLRQLSGSTLSAWNHEIRFSLSYHLVFHAPEE